LEVLLTHVFYHTWTPPTVSLAMQAREISPRPPA
jgi:hypothetical protein